MQEGSNYMKCVYACRNQRRRHRRSREGETRTGSSATRLAMTVRGAVPARSELAADGADLRSACCTW
jgi:hypothetical protein